MLIPAFALTFTHKSAKCCKQRLNLYKIERLWRKLLRWIASTLRAANEDTSGLATTIGGKTCFNFLVTQLISWLGCLPQPSLRENERDFMLRAFSKQSRHNVTPTRYAKALVGREAIG